MSLKMSLVLCYLWKKKKTSEISVFPESLFSSLPLKYAEDMERSFFKKFYFYTFKYVCVRICGH